MKILKNAAIALGVMLLAGLGFVAFYPYSDMNNDVDTGIAYAAKLGCSGVFVGNRQLDEVIKHDLVPINPIFAKLTITQTDAPKGLSVSLLGLRKRTAIYREGVGCTLLSGKITAKTLLAEPLPAPIKAAPQDWPKTAPNPDIEAALDEAFVSPKDQVDTRAVIVIHHGKIIAERYGQGFNEQSRFLGWSMSKSVTSALMGIAVSQGKLDLDAPNALKPLNVSADKAPITLRHLLSMRSGLKYQEEYGIDSDVVRMLFAEPDMAAFTASKPVTHKAGEYFNYNTGTPSVEMALLRKAVGGTLVAQVDFSRQYLFSPTGMNSVVFEADASGTLVGGSYMYATARDWARLGLLYLHDGKVGDQQIIPSEWVKLSRAPSHTGSEYGFQWWLNANPSEGKTHVAYPELPSDMYYADGHNGQFIAIFPSHDLVIVRLGWTPEGQSSHTNRLFTKIFKALPTK